MAQEVHSREQSLEQQVNFLQPPSTKIRDCKSQTRLPQRAFRQIQNEKGSRILRTYIAVLYPRYLAFLPMTINRVILSLPFAQRVDLATIQAKERNDRTLKR